ncbi:MAG: TlpA disulfide reductase family protein [Chitinophagaceae bacterium]
MRHLFLLLLYTYFGTCLLAQSQVIKATENSIVKDSSGMIYPFNIWNALVMQGDYYLWSVDKQNVNTDFLLIKLTEEQKNKRLEKMPKPRESAYFKTGIEFNPFKTKDINNNKINLKEEKGKIIVLNFWFINCPPCRMEIPALNEVVKTYKGNDSVKFIGIALDGREELKQFLKSFPFDYAIIENGRYLSERYGVRSFPTHVIINQEGKIFFHTSGLAMNTVYWLKKTIAELLSQSSVARQ